MFVLGYTVWLGAGCVHMPPEQLCLADLKKADDLRAKSKIEESAAFYREAYEADPKNLTALRDYVEVYHLMGRTGDVVARFREAIRLDERDAWAHEGLGLALFTAGGTGVDQSRAELLRATELAPEVADFHYRLGLYYIESDRFAEARDTLLKAIQLNGHLPKYRLPAALALARTGDREAAVKQLNAVLTLDPTPDEVARAEKTARNLIDPFRGFPQAAREQWEIALQWLDHDSTSQAQQVIESLLQRYPDLAIVHSLAGLTAAKMDDASRAIIELRKAIELNPDLAEPRMYLGDIYLSRGRPDNAKEHYESALQRNPFLADAYKRLAEIHLRLNDAPAAVPLYRSYILLRPNDLDARLADAKLLTDLHDPKAWESWDGMAKDYPSRVDVLVGRGRYYFELAVKCTSVYDRQRAKKEAAKSLEAAVEIDPENETAASLLSGLRKLP
jgi:tetratricopeptide (TPR) repeat protein